MTMPTLNEDVLRHIVDYISRETLNEINSANSVFFEAWMRVRFASIDITSRNKESKRLLAHLSEPDVAQHVKQLALRPWLVQPRTKSPRSRTENLMTSCMQVLDPHYSQKVAERRLQKRLSKDKERVTTALAQMCSIQEYTIDWDESTAFHPEFYHAFLVPPLEKWSNHLTALTIRVPLSMVSSLASLRLPRLESFTYHFCTGYTPLNEIHDEHDGFVVFVNNLKDSLQNLSLTSTVTSHHLDLSRIFRMMGSFPCLRRVALSIPFDGGHLSDPMAFMDFLSRHSSSLRGFSLTTSRCAIHFKPGDPEHINWIHHIIKALKKPFPLLSSFDVALRPLKAPLDVLVGFLDMHSSTLCSVSFMDRSLSIHEIKSLFKAPPYNIQELHVKTDTMSASFLAGIACWFPSLKTLKLECHRLGDIDHTSDAIFSHSDNSAFRANLRAHMHVLRDWPLEQLAIGMLEHKHNWLHIIKRDLGHFLPRLTVSPLTL